MNNNLKYPNLKIYLVGGYIRNMLWDLPSNDFDFCLTGQDSIKFCEDMGFEMVGKSFPVYFDPKTGNQFALARKETLVSTNKFEVSVDNVSVQEDLLRRDFTVNALAYEVQWEIRKKDNNDSDSESNNSNNSNLYNFVFHSPTKEEIVQGLKNKRLVLSTPEAFEDLTQKKLRHVRDHTFVEDPLRILRGIRFLANYQMSLDEKTKNLFFQMIDSKMFENMEAKRVYIEIFKMLDNPGGFDKFLNYLKEFNLDKEPCFAFLDLNEKSLTQTQKNIKELNEQKDKLFGFEYVSEILLYSVINMSIRPKDLINKYAFKSSVVKNIFVFKDFLKTFENDNLKNIEKAVDFITKYKIGQNPDLGRACVFMQYLQNNDEQMFYQNVQDLEKYCEIIDNIDFSEAAKEKNPGQYVKCLKIETIKKKTGQKTKKL